MRFSPCYRSPTLPPAASSLERSPSSLVVVSPIDRVVSRELAARTASAAASRRIGSMAMDLPTGRSVYPVEQKKRDVGVSTSL